jgi:hypothetical protein
MKGKLMKDPKQRQELSMIIERRRKDLADRLDVNKRTRDLSELSASGSRYAAKPKDMKRSTTLTLIFSAVAVVVLLACVVSAIAVTAGGFWLHGQLADDPTTTVEKYYSALHAQDYAQAYSYLTTGLKAKTPESAFDDRNSSYDKINGIVDSYPIVQSSVKDSTAIVVVNVIRRGNDATAKQETLTLTQENGDWRINDIALGGDVPIPSPSA